MINSRVAMAATALAALSMSGCDRGFAGRVESTPSGVFYVSWSGNVFRIDSGMLIPVPRAPDTGTRTLQFSQRISGVSDSGFPALVTGAVKFIDGQERIKVSILLGPLGNRLPSASDQAAFISGLQDGTGRLKGVNLSFTDSDGFPLSADESIPTRGDTWTAETAPSGAAAQYDYVSAQPAPPGLSAALSAIVVKWSSTDAPAPTPTPEPAYTPNQPAGGDTAPPDSTPPDQ